MDMNKSKMIRVTNTCIDFSKKTDFNKHLKESPNNCTFFRSDNEIKPGDKLCLIPYAYDSGNVLEMRAHEKYTHYLNRLIDFHNSGQNAFIDIDSEYNTYYDLLSLFIVTSKKIKYDGISIFNQFFGSDIKLKLIFNGNMIKHDNCWFLCFDC